MASSEGKPISLVQTLDAERPWASSSELPIAASVPLEDLGKDMQQALKEGKAASVSPQPTPRSAADTVHPEGVVLEEAPKKKGSVASAGKEILEDTLKTVFMPATILFSAAKYMKKNYVNVVTTVPKGIFNQIRKASHLSSRRPSVAEEAAQKVSEPPAPTDEPNVLKLSDLLGEDFDRGLVSKDLHFLDVDFIAAEAQDSLDAVTERVYVEALKCILFRPSELRKSRVAPDGARSVHHTSGVSLGRTILGCLRPIEKVALHPTVFYKLPMNLLDTEILYNGVQARHAYNIRTTEVMYHYLEAKIRMLIEEYFETYQREAKRIETKYEWEREDDLAFLSLLSPDEKREADLLFVQGLQGFVRMIIDTGELLGEVLDRSPSVQSILDMFVNRICESGESPIYKQLQSFDTAKRVRMNNGIRRRFEVRVIWRQLYTDDVEFFEEIQMQKLVLMYLLKQAFAVPFVVHRRIVHNLMQVSPFAVIKYHMDILVKTLTSTNPEHVDLRGQINRFNSRGEREEFEGRILTTAVKELSKLHELCGLKPQYASAILEHSRSGNFHALTDPQAFRKLGRQVVGVLFLHIDRCSHLPAADIGGTSDPFCVVTYRQAHRRVSGTTRCIQRSLDPVFNEEFGIVMYENNIKRRDPLIIKVYDEDSVGYDDYLGEVNVPLERIYSIAAQTSVRNDVLDAFQQPALHLNLPVHNGKGTKKAAATMSIRLQFMALPAYYERLTTAPYPPSAVDVSSGNQTVPWCTGVNSLSQALNWCRKCAQNIVLYAHRKRMSTMVTDLLQRELYAEFIERFGLSPAAIRVSILESHLSSLSPSLIASLATFRSDLRAKLSLSPATGELGLTARDRAELSTEVRRNNTFMENMLKQVEFLLDELWTSDDDGDDTLNRQLSALGPRCRESLKVYLRVSEQTLDYMQRQHTKRKAGPNPVGDSEDDLSDMDNQSDAIRDTLELLAKEQNTPVFRFENDPRQWKTQAQLFINFVVRMCNRYPAFRKAFGDPMASFLCSPTDDSENTLSFQETYNKIAEEVMAELIPMDFGEQGISDAAMLKKLTDVRGDSKEPRVLVNNSTARLAEGVNIIVSMDRFDRWYSTVRFRYGRADVLNTETGAQFHMLLNSFRPAFWSFARVLHRQVRLLLVATDKSIGEKTPGTDKMAWMAAHAEENQMLKMLHGRLRSFYSTYQFELEKRIMPLPSLVSSFYPIVRVWVEEIVSKMEGFVKSAVEQFSLYEERDEKKEKGALERNGSSGLSANLRLGIAVDILCLLNLCLDNSMCIALPGGCGECGPSGQKDTKDQQPFSVTGREKLKNIEVAIESQDQYYSAQLVDCIIGSVKNVSAILAMELKNRILGEMKELKSRATIPAQKLDHLFSDSDDESTDSKSSSSKKKSKKKDEFKLSAKEAKEAFSVSTGFCRILNSFEFFIEHTPELHFDCPTETSEFGKVLIACCKDQIRNSVAATLAPIEDASVRAIVEPLQVVAGPVFRTLMKSMGKTDDDFSIFSFRIFRRHKALETTVHSKDGDYDEIVAKILNPLLNYMDYVLGELRPFMYSSTFDKVLKAAYEVVVVENLEKHLLEYVKHKNVVNNDNSSILLVALKHFSDYFHADGEGISKATMQELTGTLTLMIGYCHSSHTTERLVDSYNRAVADKSDRLMEVIRRILVARGFTKYEGKGKGETKAR